MAVSFEERGRTGLHDVDSEDALYEERVWLILNPTRTQAHDCWVAGRGPRGRGYPERIIGAGQLDRVSVWTERMRGNATLRGAQGSAVCRSDD